MSLKKSYFNTALSLNLLKRFWPIWAIYLPTLIFILPVNVSSMAAHASAELLSEGIAEGFVYSSARIGIAVSLAFAPICAGAVFSYLFDSRSCTLMCSLPLRRDTCFITAYLSALVPLLLSDIIAVLTALPLLYTLPISPLHLLRWLYTLMLSNLAFFSLATLCASLTANLYVMPLLYFLINIAAWMLELACKALLSAIVYGYAYDTGLFSWLSPAVKLFDKLSVINIMPNSVTYHSYFIDALPYLICYAVVGLGLSLLALRLVKKRSMECCGDVVAIKSLRPWFKYCMAFGGAFIFAAAMYYVFFEYLVCGSSAAVLIAFLMLLGAFIGYFGAQMLIGRSLDAFRQGWRGYGAVCLCCLAFVAVAELDLFGYEQRLPSMEQLEYVSLYSENEKLSREDSLELCLKLHNRLISDKPNMDSQPDGRALGINYMLKNGKSLSRLYRIDVSPEAVEAPDSCAALLMKLQNCPELIESRVQTRFPVTPESVYNCSIGVETLSSSGIYSYNSVYLSPEQAAELYHDCIVPDSEDGTIGIIYPFDNRESRERISNLSISIDICDPKDLRSNSDKDFDYLYFQVMIDSSRCTQWIKDELGIDAIILPREIELAY